MQIGKVIRRYRQERKLTQEEMGRRLGVSGPAVNKWESGASLPDITLLAPIARLLGISLEELLSFQEDLSEMDVAVVVRRLDELSRTEPFEVVFQEAKKALEEYPGSELLALHLGVFLQAKRLFEGGGSEEARKWIRRCLEQALGSSKENISYVARDSLYQMAFHEGNLQKAAGYLDGFSEHDPEKKRRQAELCWKQGKKEEAQRALEELLLADYSRVSLCLTNMYRQAKEESDLDRAELFMEKMQELARVFELGEYQQVAGSLEIAMMRKDPERTLKAARKSLESVDSMDGLKDSPLFCHLPKKELSPEFKQQTKSTLIRLLRTEPDLDYMKEDPRWQDFLDSLDQ